MRILLIVYILAHIAVSQYGIDDIVIKACTHRMFIVVGGIISCMIKLDDFENNKTR